MKPIHTKRGLSTLAAIWVIAALVLAACGPRPALPEAAPPAEQAADQAAAPAAEAEATEAPAEEASTDSAAAGSSTAGGAYNEAPMLAELVAAGSLPPVEERLPLEPLVVEPYESIGKYGGTWHRAFTGVKDFHAWGRINYDPVLRWAPNFADPVMPGLAKAWEWNGAAWTQRATTGPACGRESMMAMSASRFDALGRKAGSHPAASMPLLLKSAMSSPRPQP